VGQWHMRCTGRCHLPVFHTSESLHGDDYVLNYKSSHAAVTCAVPSTVTNDYLRTLGMGKISSRAFFSFKAEFEPICAHAAHASMAAAVEQEERELVTMSIFDIRRSHRGAFIIDGGYATGRNAQCCTMPGMTSGTHRIFNVEIARQAEGPTAREKAFKEMDKVLKPKPVQGQSEEDRVAAQKNYDEYVEAARLAGEDAARRKDMRARLKEAKKQMYAWERELRSMYRYVFEYTAKLRGEINPAWRNSPTTSTIE